MYAKPQRVYSAHFTLALISRDIWNFGTRYKCIFNPKDNLDKIHFQRHGTFTSNFRKLRTLSKSNISHYPHNLNTKYRRFVCNVPNLYQIN